ncbi:MAG: type II toxin-antitoxin system RelE/ParE family toxin [Glaciecola sp.]|nr:type II toxin-antitoxin system RelE/ParE family toxin [Glaciecola sp.]MDG1816652.1 type II toxin-antitoxin system RelE/ParE family toxin [Glaciecola sp.]MDG2098057.1 type II toxin-antitoxin system RelE/ParE family toxin [Glaciecola sp.]
MSNGYLKSPHGSHIIFFKQTDIDTILIIRILHKRMDTSPLIP